MCIRDSFQMAAALIAHSAGPAAGAGAERILAVVLIQPVRQMLQIDRLLLQRARLFDRDGTLAELTIHTDWMRYDCYVDLSGAVLGYLTEPMPIPELSLIHISRKSMTTLRAASSRLWAFPLTA